MRLPCVNGGGSQSIVRLDRAIVVEQEVALPPGAVRALSFWRARPGSILTVVDGQNARFRARLLENNRVFPFQSMADRTRPVVPLTLYQALPEKERFELVLQKCVELGVRRIVPYVSARSTTLQQRDSRQRKSHRWPDIVLKAARQCRRADIPQLGPVMTFDQVLAETALWDVAVMLYEGETAASLRNVILQPDIANAALLIGPEGGFTRQEVNQARHLSVLPVSLGPLILRTETAAIAGTAVMQWILGALE